MVSNHQAPVQLGFDGGSNYSNYVELEPEDNHTVNNIAPAYKKSTPRRAAAMNCIESFKRDNKLK